MCILVGCAKRSTPRLITRCCIRFAASATAWESMLRRLHTTSVRLALGYVGLFAFSTLLLVALLWWRTAGYLERETEAAINTDANQLRNQLRDFGLVATEDAIRVRIAASPRARALYLLVDKD